MISPPWLSDNTIRTHPLIPSIFGEAYTPGQSSVANVEAPNRGPTYGAKGVAADHPLSAQAGMQMLQRGGNAIDAAIAAAAVNAVVKPYQTQFGGDAFALVWHKRTNEVSCLNAGGLAPQAATLERFGKGIPSYGAASCAVPGFVDALLELYAGLRDDAAGEAARAGNARRGGLPGLEAPVAGHGAHP